MKRLLFIATITFVLLLSACQPKQRVLQIGFIGTLTGTYASVGTMEMYAAQLAVEEINEDGGINGLTVELVVRDDEANPTTAVQMQNELYEMGIDIIIGHSLSIVAIEAVNNANEKGILLLSPSIGTDELTAVDDNLIRNVSTTYLEGETIAEAILDDGASKILLLYSLDNARVTDSHKNAFEAIMEENDIDTDQYVLYGFHSADNDDFDAMEALLADPSFDAVFIAGPNTDASLLVNYVKANDLDIDIHLSSWASTGIVDEIETVDTDGIYCYFDVYEPLDDPAYLAFKTSFENTYGEDITMVAINSYDLVYVLKEAIERLDDTDPISVRNAIINIGSFDGITGELEFDFYGDIQRPSYQMIIVDGEFVLVE